MCRSVNNRKGQVKTSVEEEQNVRSFKAAVVWSFIGVLFVWALTFFLFFLNPMESRGQFGDMFGAVNALFSGLAFAGLIITLILQRKELVLQRDELQMTREELKNQRKEFEQENETIRYQRFENLFYNMLNLQQRIVDGLKVEYEEDERTLVPLESGGQGYQSRRVSHEVTGRDVFQHTFVATEFVYTPEHGPNERLYGFGSVLKQSGLVYYDRVKLPTIFDHYFRHLYKILQFVDSQGFPFEEAYRYISYLRGTLSIYELVWIYYNALSPRNVKLKLLIEKYTLLKSLRREILTRTKEAGTFYDGLGMLEKEMLDNKFSSKDFEYYLTNNPGDPTKYFLSAFWKPSEIEKGEEFYRAWRSFIDSKGEGVSDSVSG